MDVLDKIKKYHNKNDFKRVRLLCKRSIGLFGKNDIDRLYAITIIYGYALIESRYKKTKNINTAIKIYKTLLNALNQKNESEKWSELHNNLGHWCAPLALYSLV